MICESADELMIRRFGGAQRDRIGRFVADSVSGRWSWSDAVFEIFGYPPWSVAPSWSLIIKHVPEEDRAVAQTGYELATTRVGPFCWSHRIDVGEAMRSAEANGIRGGAVTPHLLGHLADASAGRTLAVNVALIVANARTAGEIASVLT